MIIILEGPDGSGKSTLANDLRARLNLAYHHEGPPPADVPTVDHYASILRRYHKHNIVIDRFALGELVYGPVLRGSSRLSDSDWASLTRMIHDVGAHEVICLPPPVSARAAWEGRKGELFKDPAVLYEVYARYAYFAVRAPQRFIRWDYTCMSLQQLCHEFEVRRR